MAGNFIRVTCRWLDLNLFPNAPSSHPVASRRSLIFLAVGVASVLIIQARMWTSKPLDSIFGEDGYLYLSEAMRFGFYRNVTTPYNGYLQVLPRLLAELIAQLPVNWFVGGMADIGCDRGHRMCLRRVVGERWPYPQPDSPRRPREHRS